MSSLMFEEKATTKKLFPSTAAATAVATAAIEKISQ
jgi:hypothetical protein